LASAIPELYRRPETRGRLGEAARRTVAEKHSQEAMLRRLEQIYLNILAKKKSGR
jgi:glycosyltransferase involved in cell wall biosynthesis